MTTSRWRTPERPWAWPTARRRRGATTGFTYVEMVMVVFILSILAAIAVPVYQAQVLASKESVLRHNLAIVRERLDQFKADQDRYPSSLQELVERGYFREIPEDPFTGANEWEEVFEDYDPDQPDQEPGVFDVRSLSPEIGTDGRPYNEW